MITGLVLVLVCGVIADRLAGLQHFVGAPIIGLFLGVIISNLLPQKFVEATKKGAEFAAKYLLKAGIILVGGTLNFMSVISTGSTALPLIIFNILLSFLVTFLVGRQMQVSGKTRTLVGGGTAICGGTAIATLTPIIKAKESEMAYAMTAIFLFDVFAAIMWPYAATAMQLSADQYAFLGGLAISDTSSVTAAAATFDSLSGGLKTLGGITGGDAAVVVKLSRTVMLVFVALVVMVLSNWKKSQAQSGNAPAAKKDFLKNVVKAFPLFVLFFLIMAILNTAFDFGSVQLFGFSLSDFLSRAYKYLIAVALVGIGYKIQLKGLLKNGWKPILLGGCAWLAVSLSTLCYIFLFL